MISNHLSQSRASSDEEEQQQHRFPENGKDENGNTYSVKEMKEEAAAGGGPVRGFSRFSPTMRSI